VAAGFSEANADSVSEAVSADDDGVVVVDECALGAIVEGEGFLAAPCELEHGAVGGGLGAGDGSGGDDVAFADVAAVDGVVGEHLVDVPIEVFHIGLGHDGFGGVLGLDGYLEVDVEVAVGG
jgi:hypothetical protein